MEKIFDKAEEMVGNIKEYVNNGLNDIKLKVAEKTSAIIANLVAGLMTVFVFLLVIIFGGITLSFGLGEWIGKIWLGFLVVTIIYLLLGVIIWKLRKRIIQFPIMNAILDQLMNNQDEQD